MSDGVTILLLALLSGLVAVDTTAALQLMFSQPVVAGAIAGAIAGQPAIGLMVGLTLQLVWVGALPVGGAGFPDSGVAAVVGAGAAGVLVSGGYAEGSAVAVGIVLALIVGWMGRSVVTGLRRWNVDIAERARAGLEGGDASAVRRAILQAIGARFGVAAATSGAVLSLTVLVAELVLPREGPASYPALLWAAPIAVGSIVAASRGWGERFGVVVGLAAGALFIVWM